MAVTRLQVFYSKGPQGKWTNVYHADASGLGVVADAFELALMPQLLGLLHIACSIDKVLVSSLEDDTFIERSYGTPGSNGDTEDLLPLFACAKVLFATDGLGRPDYKYLKGILTDDANESGFIASSVITHIVTLFNDAIADMSTNSAPLCSDDGALWTGASVKAEIQERQMHRRRRRAAVPTP